MIHGSYITYSNSDCRCSPCRDAWAAWTRVARARRAAALTDDDPRHGMYTTYTNYACRCDKCRAAHTEWLRSRGSAS